MSAGVQAPRIAIPPAKGSTLERAYRANNVGVAWLERFDYAKAAAAFRDALALQPSMGIAHFNLALAELYDNRLAEADAEARAAVATMGGGAAPDYVLGLIAKAQGRPAAALPAFARAAQADPQDAATQILLGQTRLQQGDAAGAVANFKAALDLEPYSATAAYNLSVALSRTGRADDSRKMLLQFQSLREHGGTTLGSGYLEQGPHAQGIASTGAEPDLVDRALPNVRFVAEPVSAARRASAGGAIALFDLDGDGDLELAEAADDGVSLFRNTGGRLVSGGLARLTARGLVPSVVLAADYDNDGRTDLLVAGQGAVSLYRNRGAGVFTAVTAASRLRAATADVPLSAAFVDIDHDGDLDLMVSGGVWRNNGDGTFADVSAASGLTVARATAIVPTDFDERRDVDLLVATEDGRLALYRNMRDGTFRDAARDAGLTASGRLTALAAGDLNRDARMDFVITRSDGNAVLALSSSPAKYRLEPAPAGAANATAAATLDYDNDGLTDLLVYSNGRLRLLRSLGNGWDDVTGRALSGVPDLPLSAVAPGRSIAIGDVDGDGDDDIVVRSERGIQLLRNEGGNQRGALRVRLAARVSNRTAAGSRIEMRAGTLHVRRETYAVSPAPAPVDLVLGLGGRAAVDAVRVQWPAGIVQSEIQPPSRLKLTISELDRKPSSCPFLFTWNGSRFEFLTDFLGGGEQGYWLAPGVRSEPDPDEYVRIPAEALRERAGRYELRVTNELEEVLYVDHLHLEAVAHPPGTEVYPNEGLTAPPYAPHSLFAVRDLRPVDAAVDDSGTDLTPVLRSIDRAYANGFALDRIRGYAAPHTLTVRLKADTTLTNDALLLTGWTDYAFSSDNVAAYQRGLRMMPPQLQVRDASGSWRTAVADIGIPVGRPQTLVVDLRQPALAGHRELRIVTNMRIYWDRIATAAIDGGSDQGQTRVRPGSDQGQTGVRPGSDRGQTGVRPLARSSIRLDPMTAALRWRGFSAEVTPDGREPFTYDYDTITAVSPWKTMPGQYTAEGDVREPLATVDARFVLMMPGDELALAFDAHNLPPLPPGWTRTFLLYGYGFSKEMDLNSASPDRVGLSGHQAAVFKPSRTVIAPLSSIDSLLLDATRAISRPSSSR